MFRDVPAPSTILEGYCKLTPFGFRPLNPEIQATIDAADKPKKEGKGAKKGEKKTIVKEATSEDEFDTQSDIRIEKNPPVRNEDVHNEFIRNEEVHNKDVCNNDDNIRNEEQTSNPKVTQHLNNFVPSHPPSPKTTTTPITIAPCPPPFSSQQQTNIPLSSPLFTDSTVPPTTSIEPPVSVNRRKLADSLIVLSTKVKLQSLHEKIDQLILSFKALSYDAYTKATIECFIERISKEHYANAEKMNKAVADSTEVCKTTTGKVVKLISDTFFFMENFQTTFNSNTTIANEALKSLGSLFKFEKVKLQEIRTGFKTKHEAFQTSISSQISNL
ncbi:unnamed protein product [Lactuca saligna]|uniref:Uncharacterized protein n=1 Tax=Lactuca saligna TaxID=75948 RepID=A0AA35Y651_LACSI|nr:unnamed protein product [Lactuca saligna]